MLGEDDSPGLCFFWFVCVSSDGEAWVVFADSFSAYDDGVYFCSDAVDFLSGEFCCEPLTFAFWSGDSTIEADGGFGDYPGESCCDSFGE